MHQTKEDIGCLFKRCLYNKVGWYTHAWGYYTATHRGGDEWTTAIIATQVMSGDGQRW